VSSQLHFPAALPPGKQPLLSIGQEARWAPESVWMRWESKNSIIAPAENWIPIVQPVAQSPIPTELPQFHQKHWKHRTCVVLSNNSTFLSRNNVSLPKTHCKIGQHFRFQTMCNFIVFAGFRCWIRLSNQWRFMSQWRAWQIPCRSHYIDSCSHTVLWR